MEQALNSELITIPESMCSAIGIHLSALNGTLKWSNRSGHINSRHFDVIQLRYSTHEYAKTDVFDYIKLFYNKKRKHGSNNMLSLIEFE